MRNATIHTKHLKFEDEILEFVFGQQMIEIKYDQNLRLRNQYLGAD